MFLFGKFPKSVFCILKCITL